MKIVCKNVAFKFVFFIEKRQDIKSVGHEVHAGVNCTLVSYSDQVVVG